MNAIPIHPDRRHEIRRLLALPPADVTARAASRLVVLDDLHAVHRAMADTVADELRANPRAVCILPVGPVGYFPMLADTIRAEGLSLASARFFFMDEYADDAGRALPAEHPLSFAGVVNRLFLDPLGPDFAPAEVVFPGQQNIHDLASHLADLGGVDLCLGGIGIHGHLAFNEPEPGVIQAPPRLVHLNDFTVTINAIRAGVGGNLEGFPRQAYTLGMPQLLGARRLRLACRNGIGLDWANTVLRLTLFGQPGEDYPCTHAHTHPDFRLFTDHDTLQCPANIL